MQKVAFSYSFQPKAACPHVFLRDPPLSEKWKMLNYYCEDINFQITPPNKFEGATIYTLSIGSNFATAGIMSFICA